MYRIAILDDNAQEAEGIASKVRQYPDADQLDVTVATDPEDIRQALCAGRVDVLFTDIALAPNSPDGISIVRDWIDVGSGTQVIYVTAYNQYHTRIYQTQHAYFLMKPVSQLDVDAALDKALHAVNRYKSMPLRIHTRDDDKVVPPEDIVFIESDRRILNIHTTEGTFQTYAKIIDVIAKLPPRFIQCHKSFIVNMDYISDFTPSSLTVRTGDVIPISKSRYKDVRNAFFGHVRPID